MKTNNTFTEFLAIFLHLFFLKKDLCIHKNNFSYLLTSYQLILFLEDFLLWFKLRIKANIIETVIKEFLH